jgi:hypothetical protein
MATLMTGEGIRMPRVMSGIVDDVDRRKPDDADDYQAKEHCHHRRQNCACGAGLHAGERCRGSLYGHAGLLNQQYFFIVVGFESCRDDEGGRKLDNPAKWVNGETKAVLPRHGWSGGSLRH